MNFQKTFTPNTWWGKALGGFFGYLIAGSVGALIGIFIGNFFDKGLVNYFSQFYGAAHRKYNHAIQDVFFQTTFSIMGHIAKVDGRVSEKEITMAKQMMLELNLTKEQKKLAQMHFNEGKSPLFSVSKALDRLLQACPHNIELLKLFMDTQYRCAQVDGLSKNKIRALDNIFSYLGFSPLHQQYRFYEDFSNQQSYSRSSSESQYNYSNQNYRNSNTTLEQAYALLEVDNSIAQQDLKRAYRRLISRNHPDKLIAQGLPAEMIKLATDKTQKITKAYELICNSKGWN